MPARIPVDTLTPPPRAILVAKQLRRDLQSGLFTGKLPSERQLATNLGVARDTVRAALKILEQEGLSVERTPTGTYIQSLDFKISQSNLSVGLVHFTKLEYLSHKTLFWIDELRQILYREKVRLHLYHINNKRDGHHKFHSIRASIKHACWIFTYPTTPLIESIYDQRSNTVVMGSVPDHIALPSIDVHYEALYRHAINQLIRLGHRHIALIMPKRKLSIDKDILQGFQLAVTPHSDLQVRIEYHDGTPAALCQLADRLLTRSSRPTTWIVTVPSHFLTILTYLPRRNIRVPQDISLLCQDGEPWFHFATPTPTHYQVNLSKLARLTAQQVLKAIAGTPSPFLRHQIIPEFIPGNTLAEAVANEEP